MFAVVNEAGGTAPFARLGMPGVALAGKTGSSQVRRVSRWAREHGHFNSASLPWEFRPHALFVCFAPYDAPRYACAVVVEHGNAGAGVAAPVARDIMRERFDAIRRGGWWRRGSAWRRGRDGGFPSHAVLRGHCSPGALAHPDGLRNPIAVIRR